MLGHGSCVECLRKPLVLWAPELACWGTQYWTCVAARHEACAGSIVEETRKKIILLLQLQILPNRVTSCSPFRLYGSTRTLRHFILTVCTALLNNCDGLRTASTGSPRTIFASKRTKPTLQDANQKSREVISLCPPVFYSRDAQRS